MKNFRGVTLIAVFDDEVEIISGFSVDLLVFLYRQPRGKQ